MRGDLIRAIRGPSGGLLASVLVAAVFGGAAIAAPRSSFHVSNRPANVRTPDGQSTDGTAVVAPSVGRSGQQSDGGTVRRDPEVVSHRRVDGHGRRAPQGQGAGQGREHSSHAHPDAPCLAEAGHRRE